MSSKRRLAAAKPSSHGCFGKSIGGGYLEFDADFHDLRAWNLEIRAVPLGVELAYIVNNSEAKVLSLARPLARAWTWQGFTAFSERTCAAA
jgi:hypothetical protein